jgi:hypothetical protein
MSKTQGMEPWTHVCLPSGEISITPHNTFRPGLVNPSTSHPWRPTVLSRGEERTLAVRHEVGSNSGVLVHRIRGDRQRPELGELKVGVRLEDFE